MRHRSWATFAAALSIAGAAGAADPAPMMPVDVSAIPGSEFIGHGREAQFDRNTRGQPMTTIRDNFILKLPATNGELVPVIVVTEITSSRESPFADKTEAALQQKKPRKKTSEGEFDDAATIDGSLFELSGFGPAGTRSSKDSLMYFGNHGGRRYMVHATYESHKISTEAVRAALEGVRLPTTEVAAVTDTFDAFAATAVSPQGLRTPVGLLSFKEAPKFGLFRVRTNNTHGKDFRAANYLTTFLSGRGELVAYCSQVDSGADRLKVERELLSSDVTSEVSEPTVVAGTSPEIHHYDYLRKSYSGGSVREELWIKVHDGQVLTVSTTSGALKKESRAALATQLAAARCQPLLSP